MHKNNLFLYTLLFILAFVIYDFQDENYFQVNDCYAIERSTTVDLDTTIVIDKIERDYAKYYLKNNPSEILPLRVVGVRNSIYKQIKCE